MVSGRVLNGHEVISGITRVCSRCSTRIEEGHDDPDTKNQQVDDSEKPNYEQNERIRRIFFKPAQGKSKHYIAAEKFANKVVCLIDEAEVLKNKACQLVGRDLRLFLRNSAKDNKFRHLVCEVLERKLKNRDLQNLV